MSTSYGARSAKTGLASKALDAALGAAFDAMSAGAGRRLTSQLIVGPALSQKLAIGGRRLQSTCLFRVLACWVLAVCMCVCVFLVCGALVGRLFGTLFRLLVVWYRYVCAFGCVV